MAKRGRSARSPKRKLKGNIKGLCYECSGPVNVGRHWFVEDPNGYHHYKCCKYDFDKLFPALGSVEERLEFFEN
jgi:hypothetical protein